MIEQEAILKDSPKYYLSTYKEKFSIFYVFLRERFLFMVFTDQSASFSSFEYKKKVFEYTDNETIQMLQVAKVLFPEATQVSREVYERSIGIVNKELFETEFSKN